MPCSKVILINSKFYALLLPHKISHGIFTPLFKHEQERLSVSYQYAVNVVSIQVSGRSLQQPPVPAFVVGDVRLDLAVLPLVSNQHAFNSCHLMDRDTQQVEPYLYLNQEGAIYVYPSCNSLVLHWR